MHPSQVSGFQPLPRQAGVYALLLELPKLRRLRIGSLGELDFPSGVYVYLGNAFGPGGIRSRLGRHLRGDGKPRWHIDHFRPAAQVISTCYGIPAQPEKYFFKLECQWSQALAHMTQADIPAPGFGASDCTAGCPSHLIAFPANIDLDKLHKVLILETKPPLERIICSPLPPSSPASRTCGKIVPT